MTNLIVPSAHSSPPFPKNPAAAADSEVAPWRGILAVEPDTTVLHAKSLLLAKANYCVTPATGDGDLFSLRNTKTFALAILSDRLGRQLLQAVAATVRRQWPRIRILILGQVPIAFEDSLYDERISRSSDPQQVLADLENLYEGMWNQRSNTIDWNAATPARSSASPRIPHSDPVAIPSDIRTPAAGAKAFSQLM
jgi:hypothetical protein